VEAVDEFVVVAGLIVAGHVEKCLRDRQRGAQFVGGVGCESLLFGDVCLESYEHCVEGVGELAELVFAAFQLDSVRERSGRGRACGVRDAEVDLRREDTLCPRVRDERGDFEAILRLTSGPARRTVGTGFRGIRKGGR
jgi:hypothetical protein